MLKDMQVSSGERPELHKSLSFLKAVCDGDAPCARAPLRQCALTIWKIKYVEKTIHIE